VGHKRGKGGGGGGVGEREKKGNDFCADREVHDLNRRGLESDGRNFSLGYFPGGGGAKLNLRALQP